jgi:hypothetical protein
MLTGSDDRCLISVIWKRRLVAGRRLMRLIHET